MTTSSTTWSDQDLDDMLGELPTGKVEFIAYAQRHREKVAANCPDWLAMPLIIPANGQIDDADFAAQVERLWEVTHPSVSRPASKVRAKRPRRTRRNWQRQGLGENLSASQA